MKLRSIIENEYAGLEDNDEFEEFPSMQNEYDDLSSFADIAYANNIPIETVLSVATQLRDAGELEGVYWDELEEFHDIADEDVQVITLAVTQ